MLVQLRLSRSFDQHESALVYLGQKVVESSSVGIAEAAAWINNVMVLVGGIQVELDVTPPSFARPIVDRLLDAYPQVVSVSKAYFGHEPLIEFSSEDQSWRTAKAVLPVPIRIDRTKPIRGEIAAGINIGQTSIKVAICRADEIIVGSTVIMRTWPMSEPKTAVVLLDRIRRAIASAADGARLTVSSLQAIGISISSIVRSSGEILRHGIALGMDDNEYDELRQITSKVESSFDVPCIVEQDAITKAYAASLLQNVTSGFIIDIGTSTGGAFTDADGNVPDLLGQVGRIAIDTSAHAIPRPDGGGIGCLSQYLSAAGILRLAASCGLHIRDTADLELCSGRSEVAAMVDACANYIFSAIEIASLIHSMRNVLLSGGLMSGRFGDLLLTEVQQRALTSPQFATPTYLRSTAPRFDGCIGAALLAQHLVSK